MRKKLTYERILELFAESDRKMQESRAETDRKMQESGAETDRRMQETDRRLQELERFLKESSAETARRFQETEKYIKEIGKQVGSITDSLGRFAEEQVRPKILELFADKGIDLEYMTPHFTVKKEGKFVLEIDLLLINSIYSVAVEVKNTLRYQDIDDHIERLDKLQSLCPNIIKGTTLFGAVAGMIVNEEVEKYAIKAGFYVIKPAGSNVFICNEKDFVAKTWLIMPENK